MKRKNCITSFSGVIHMKLDISIPTTEWEHIFTDIILARGAEYCKKGVVKELKQNDTSINADVVGTETYHVRIELQNQRIPELTCDCPYAADGSRACKHMAAVLFAALAPDKAANFKSNKKPRAAKPLPPPKPNCTQVTVRLVDEDTIAQRYCAIPEVKVGDYVVFLLNDRETIGLVEEITQMPRH